MKRFFHTAGPCEHSRHDVIDAEFRLPEVHDLHDDKAQVRGTASPFNVTRLVEHLTPSGRPVSVLRA